MTHKVCNGVEMAHWVTALIRFLKSTDENRCSNMDYLETKEGKRYFKHRDFGGILRIHGQEIDQIESFSFAEYLSDHKKEEPKIFYASSFRLLKPKDLTEGEFSYYVISCEGNLRIFYKKEGNSFLMSSFSEILDECPRFREELKSFVL